MNYDELNVRLAALRDGDMTAFDEIYNELKTPVYTVIVRTVRDERLAEDILQEVFIKLYRSPLSEDVKNPRAYIFQMARNLAIDGTKKISDNASLDDALYDTFSAPETDIPLRLDVESALASLSDDDRAIVTLHVNGAFKFREVAELMGLPLGTVLWRYQKAVSELRKILSGGAI